MKWDRQKVHSLLFYIYVYFFPKKMQTTPQYCISGLLGLQEGQELQRGTKKSLRVMDIFIILIVVMVCTGMYMSKLIKLCILNTCSVLYANYTSIKMLKNKRNQASLEKCWIQRRTRWKWNIFLCQKIKYYSKNNENISKEHEGASTGWFWNNVCLKIANDNNGLSIE